MREPGFLSLIFTPLPDVLSACAFALELCSVICGNRNDVTDASCREIPYANVFQYCVFLEAQSGCKLFY